MLLALTLTPGLVLALLPTDTNTGECRIENRLETPTSERWFGTDTFGCNYLPLVVRGASTSLTVALGATVVALALAVGGGAAAGYYGGWVDSVVSRITDAALALPSLVGAILILTVVAPSSGRRPLHIALALGFVAWPVLLRIVRASVIEESALGYVEAARSVGLPNHRILTGHVVPNAMGPLVAYVSITVGAVVAAEATLTFLGAGLAPDAISWGNQIRFALPQVRAGNGYALLFPAAALALTSVAFVFLGERLRTRIERERPRWLPPGGQVWASPEATELRVWP